jgi:hypothetical protein
VKERDPKKDQHPEDLIACGLLVLAVVLVGLVFALCNLFGLILKEVIK